VAALEAQIAAAEKELPGGESVTVFRRLRKAHGAGALAELEDQSCSACDHNLTSQDLVRLRTGEFVCCRGCARILYLT
jgi:predicted  nucleic acid-binding Zn-ribbon protein